MKTSSLKSRFIIFAAILVIPIALSALVSLFISHNINENYNHILNRISMTNDIKKFMKESLQSFNKYIQENSQEGRDQYEISCQNAISLVEKLQDDSLNDSSYILRDLLNSLTSYKESGDRTISKYIKKEGINDYYSDYLKTKEIASYCDDYTSKLINSYLYYNSLIYEKLSKNTGFIYRLLISYILISIAISIFYTLFFLGNITNKLKELVVVSKKVSKGDFDYVEGKKTNLYELDILSEAFSKMIKDILKHINSLKENAELERKLSEEEMKLLKTNYALRQSELKVLQSQINPHFLFNTLNCINQTAIKEKAVNTEKLIRAVSEILRYSLSMMDRNATLENEIDIVKKYIYIQQLRFEDRLKFELEINADLKKYKVPAMTLQPFVENAFIHGIEPMEEGGLISIKIKDMNQFCVIKIEDTGCGIEESTLLKIRANDIEQEHKGHTTGLGIKSVVKRFELNYGFTDLFFIDSKRGEGTTIILRIPSSSNEADPNF
ncbi:MAG TPA: sensor histidine kinase [Clostridia bacterium]|nr:sensor histidine kinase [Clostridia bacterium]